MEEEWDAINQETIDGLIESMVERVDAIVAVNGNHIKWSNWSFKQLPTGGIVDILGFLISLFFLSR